MRKSIMPLVLISLALLFTSCSAKSAISPDAVLAYCEENDCKETDIKVDDLDFDRSHSIFSKNVYSQDSEPLDEKPICWCDNAVVLVFANNKEDVYKGAACFAGEIVDEAGLDDYFSEIRSSDDIISGHDKETDLNYILMCDKGYADYFLYDDRYCMGFFVYIDDYSGDDVTTRLDYLKKICKKLDVPSPWKIAKDELQDIYDEKGGYYMKC